MRVRWLEEGPIRYCDMKIVVTGAGVRLMAEWIYFLDLVENKYNSGRTPRKYKLMPWCAVFSAHEKRPGGIAVFIETSEWWRS